MPSGLATQPHYEHGEEMCRGHQVLAALCTGCTLAPGVCAPLGSLTPDVIYLLWISVSARFEERESGQECGQDTQSTGPVEVVQETWTCLLFLRGELGQMLWEGRLGCACPTALRLLEAFLTSLPSGC